MAWGQAIAQGLGRLGSEIGTAEDQQIKIALDTIQSKLMQQEVQQRMREQDLRMKQMQAPQTTFLPTPGGGTSAVQISSTGQIGQAQPVIPGTPAPSPEQVKAIVDTLPPERRATAQQLSQILPPQDMMKWMEQQSLHEPPPKPPDATAEKRAQAEKDAEALGYKRGTTPWLKKVIELTNPSGAKVTFGILPPGMAGLGNVPSFAGGSVAGTGAVDSNPNFAAIKAKNPQMAALVKQIADYQINPQTLSNRGGHREQVLGLVSLIDPTYDQTQFASRAALRKDFNSGKAAANIRSLNTAVNHLSHFLEAGKALNNSPLQVWNLIANKGLSATGDSRIARFNAAADAVEGEMATVFKGTSGTDQEIKAWRNNLSMAMSPEQIKASVTELVGLMGGRLQALDDQWTRGMGKPRDFGILSPSSRRILEKMGTPMEDQGAGGTSIPSGAGAGTPVLVNGKVVGYTTDGRTMTPVK